MKKLLSILAVAVLVTSALAFTNYNKAINYCVKNAAGTSCAVIQNRFECTNGTNFQHFPLGPGKWDGTTARCNSASPVTDCITPIKLCID